MKVRSGRQVCVRAPRHLQSFRQGNPIRNCQVCRIGQNWGPAPTRANRWIWNHRVIRGGFLGFSTLSCRGCSSISVSHSIRALATTSMPWVEGRPPPSRVSINTRRRVCALRAISKVSGRETPSGTAKYAASDRIGALPPPVMT